MEKRVQNPSDNSKSYTRRYQYDGDEAFAELNGNNELLAAYTYSKLSPDDVLSMTVTTAGSLAGLSPSAGTFYFLKDALGSITDVIDGAGNILQRMEYSSFGKMLKVTNSVGTDTTPNPGFDLSYTYTGREPDKETGLMYYRARYYDPSIGRFLQEDPHPGELTNPITANNKYTYCGNTPTVFKDPTGRIFGIDDLVFLGIAAIVGGLAKDYDRQGGNFFTNFTQGALEGVIAGAAILGIYYGANFLFNFSSSMISESFTSLSELSDLAKVAFEDFTLGGEILGSTIAAPAIPGAFQDVSRYRGRSRIQDRGSISYFRDASYLGYLTVGAGSVWEIPFQRGFLW